MTSLLAAINLSFIKENSSTLIKMVSFFAFSLTLSSCKQSFDSSVSSTNNQGKIAEATNNINIWPALDYSKTYDPEVEKKVEELLSGMTIEQKVAQMIQPEIRDVTVEDMRRYGFGSYLNGGGAFPQNNKHSTPKDWIALAEDMYQASIDDSIDGSKIPAIWGTDAVHGHNNVIGATLFPHNIGLGATNNPELIEKIAQATAEEVMATGIDWVFAPTVAVVRDNRWGRTYEGYSEDPEIVKSYAASIVQGLQGSVDADFLSDKRVISTVKHFLGDGGTEGGVDQGDNINDEQTLFDIHAQGYVGGLSAGAQTVMASFNSWHGEKMHGQRYLLTDVLKNKMGFDGFIVGDWLGHGQIKGCTNYNCPQAINAGLDVFMASGDSWKPLLENTLAQAKSGEIKMSRIDDAVSRVLRVKIRAGIFDKPSPANRPLSGRIDLIGSKEHRETARQAVRESLVLLKNSNQVLPINPSKTIMVAGDAAHNIGKQSGGWTITWQGTNNTNEDFPGGTSIYQGFADATEQAGGKAFLSIDGSYDTKPDVAVVVFGEEPYAEGVGDVENVNYQQGYKTDLALLERLKAQGIPVVSVFISGRPLYVNAELNASDAFIAAWLPGTEGNGISDVLLTDKNGKVQYEFSGRLSYSWPSSPLQTVVNRDDEDYTPLLPYGFGLAYKQAHNETQTLLADTLDVEVVAEKTRNVVFFDKTLSDGFVAVARSKEQSSEMTSNIIEVGGLQARTIDKEVQEDARQLVFKGDPTSMFYISSKQEIDLTEQHAEGRSLFINLRVESPISSAVMLGMQCKKGCDNQIDISKQLKQIGVNQWQEIHVSLACFEKAGVSLANVTSPFQLSSEGPLKVSFSEVSIRHVPNVHDCT